jgi:hypothetical protein
MPIDSHIWNIISVTRFTWTPETLLRNKRAGTIETQECPDRTGHQQSSMQIRLADYMIVVGICPIFRPWTLHLVSKNLCPGQILEPQPPIMITDDDENEPHEEWDFLDIVECQQAKRCGIHCKTRFVGNRDGGICIRPGRRGPFQACKSG